MAKKKKKKNGITWKTKGFENLLGKALKNAIRALGKQIQINGIHLVGQAAKRAPELTGLLQGSGFSEVIPGKKIRVLVAFNQSYAGAMHEKDYVLGPGSEDKQATMGVTVGRKFLSRAITEYAHKYHKANGAAIEKAIRSTKGIVE